MTWCLWLQEEEAGREQDALDLYQHSLGELLLLLAGEALITALPEHLLLCPYHAPSLFSQGSPQAGDGNYFTLRCPLGLGVLKGLHLASLTLLPSGRISLGSLGVFQVWESYLTDLISW